MKKLILFLILMILIIPAQENKTLDDLINATVEKTMAEFRVPGIAVAVVKDGKVILSEGFGETEYGSGQKVNSETLFAVASNSKAFTTAALSILVDRGLITWDDKITSYIPQLKLYNHYVTGEFTIRDCVTHRSGLDLGAGDLMVWPSTDFTREEIIKNIRYLKPKSGFRSKYDYDNLLYMVAGEVIPAVTGKSWEEFVADEILKPLEMERTLVNIKDLAGKKNYAKPHVVVEDEYIITELDRVDNIAAAAGIVSTVNDMSKWMLTQLNRGKISGSEKRLFSKKMSSEMWKPQTIIFGGPDKVGSFQSNFITYGLGWGLRDFRGKYMVSHSGALTGMYSKVTMIPELELGIVVLTNQQSGAAFSVVTNTILDHFIDGGTEDWIAYYSEKSFERLDIEMEVEAMIDSVKALDNPPSMPIEEFAGTYRDNWRGDITIKSVDGKMRLVFDRTDKLAGTMEHFQYNTFIVNWDARELHADVLVSFNLDFEGKIKTMKMVPVSPLTDFSFDFEHLEFQPVK